MLNLIKHLKPFTWGVILIFLLLFGGAMADLSLPGYMAKIVNIGIQQNGVENQVPEAVRASEFDKLVLLMNSSDNEVATANYRLLDSSSLSDTDYTQYVGKYPLLSSTSLYVLNTTDKNKIKELDAIFGQVIPLVSGIELNGLTLPEGSGIQIPPGTDPFVFLSGQSTEQRTAIIDAATAQLQAVPESTLKQYSIIYIIAEYKAVGISISGIQTGYMFRIGGLMLLLTLASAASSVVVGYISAKIAAALGRNLRRKLFTRVESFSNTEFDKFSTASLITRSTNDITQIQMLMVMLFRFVFYAPIIGVGGIIKVLNADRSMLWIIAAAVGLLLTMMVIMFIVALPKFRSMQNLVDKLNLATRELLSGSLVIRAFNNQSHEEGKFDQANKEFTGVSLFINRVIVLLMPMMNLIMNGVMLLIIWIGAHQIDMGSMQVGDMMAFMQYAMQIIMAFLMISIVFIMLPRASVAVDRIEEVLQTEPVIKNPKSPRKFSGEKKGLVEFQDVSYRYPGAEEDVLKHITFSAKPGQTTAFIGSTGSGKSTLVNLIMRFYDVTDGKVMVDGMDVRDVNQHDLRDKIGYVPQKAVLFSGTIKGNIKYADEKLTDEEVAKFAETAQATEFISTSEKGMATAIAQGGTNLSGGQKQRISIARALAKKPEIYIFDDSFSALDYKTDAALRKALKEQTNQATVLIVTQRIGPIMGAEQIVTLDNGSIVGIGTHKELMESNPVYREIALSQLSEEELN
jgi:ATP-binding cassette, subfamily B, multidrug efflux pump